MECVELQLSTLDLVPKVCVENLADQMQGLESVAQIQAHYLLDMHFWIQKFCLSGIHRSQKNLQTF